MAGLLGVSFIATSISQGYIYNTGKKGGLFIFRTISNRSAIVSFSTERGIKFFNTSIDNFFTNTDEIGLYFYFNDESELCIKNNGTGSIYPLVGILI